MKHAGPVALKRLAKLLAEVRKLDLTEVKPGIFYRKRTAFLHFHEDPTGLFADVKVASSFQRLSVSSRADQREVLQVVRAQFKKPQ